jgi:hypothetical protein
VTVLTFRLNYKLATAWEKTTTTSTLTPLPVVGSSSRFNDYGEQEPAATADGFDRDAGDYDDADEQW